MSLSDSRYEFGYYDKNRRDTEVKKIFPPGHVSAEEDYQNNDGKDWNDEGKINKHWAPFFIQKIR
jgi:hypothetical protein